MMVVTLLLTTGKGHVHRTVVIHRSMLDNAVSQVQQYLDTREGEEELRSRSLLTDHIPCANNKVRGVLGVCRNFVQTSNKRKTSLLQALKALKKKKHKFYEPKTTTTDATTSVTSTATTTATTTSSSTAKQLLDNDHESETQNIE